MYEQDTRGQQRHSEPHSQIPANRPPRSPEARRRAQARAKARARARKLARIRAALYILVIVVAVFVLISVIRSGKDGKDNQAGEGTVQLSDTKGNSSKEETRVPVVREPVSFAAEDVQHVSYRTICRCQVDAEECLLAPLNWNLSAQNAKVLIFHSHISESYTKVPGQDYSEHEPYRTENNDYNVAAVGERLAQVLRDAGVEVIHDTTNYEIPNTDYAYDTARDSLEQYLRDNPDIVLVIDLHRDAALTEEGNQWGPTVVVDGKETARISFAVGTGCYIGGDNHWEENFSVTSKVQTLLEKLYPGITREILVSSSQYNQDLPAKFMLAEVGLAGNTLQEALDAADCLAEAILTLSLGTAAE